ncbi:M10 family metallopeptidase C-terminal domain-containing protein [Hyphomicrobiales bacterium]|nr:M10 family metallopeptidase C-terminal domain-containing protein [Hyphomicrobiales bacterium]
MVVITGKNTLAPEFIVSTDTGLDGVLQVSIIDSRAGEELQQQQINDASDSRGGTAALLYSGKHILHCKHAIEGAGYGGNTPEDIKYWYIFAEGPEGKVSLEVERVEAYRLNGELLFEGSTNYDFSIITLKDEAPDWIDRYEIYRETDEIGKDYLRVGYGMEGLGEYGRGDGFLPKEFWSSDSEGGQLVKRFGSNTYDMTKAEFFQKDPNAWDNAQLGPITAKQTILKSDFDDGTSVNDTFAQGNNDLNNIVEMKNVPHLGLGKWEVGSSPGNSGGPNFINGRIAGVGSGGGADHPNGQLIDGTDDRQDGYGWHMEDSRVSSVIEWIEGIVGKNDNTSLITLPGTMVDDNLKTTGGPNKFYGYAGDDIIAGGDKEDIAGFRDISSNYTITKDAKGLIKVKHSTFSVNTIDDGTDTLTGIEKLKFTDKVIDASSINLTTSSLEITQDGNFNPFNRYIDVYDLRIFYLDDVSESFAKKVAASYEAILGSGDIINTEDQSLLKETIREYYVYQKVGVQGPENYGGSEPPNLEIRGSYDEYQTDYIWELSSESLSSSQINEVFEHILHTITAVALPLIYDDWKWQNPSSKINLAMQQAVDGGYYDISQYDSIKGDSEAYTKTLATEFAYWFILAEWDYYSISGMNETNEFTLRTSKDIAEKLPLAHELYQDIVTKVLAVPNKTFTEALFSREKEYDFSTHIAGGSNEKISEEKNSNSSDAEDISTSSAKSQQTYNESNQTIETIEKSGKWYIDSLLNNSLGKPKKWVSDPDLTAQYSVNNSTVISYSFPGLNTTTPLYSYEDDRGEISAIPFSSAQADDIRQAFKEISKFVNITFVEIEEDGSSAGTIRLAMNTITDEAGNYREGIAATADPPSEEPRGGDVFFNKQFNSGNFSTGLVQNSETGVGDVTVLYHEIFHALGMEHPVDNKEILFQESKNSREYTVMADEFSSENGADFNLNGNNYTVASTPMVYDIAPLQYLYGANMSHNASDTTYSYKPDTPFIEAIWDAGGTDTLDFSNFSKANTISLVDGEYSTIGFDVDWSMTDNLGIAFDAIIENAIGGSGDDTIKGNSSNNIINGGLGDDTVIYNDEYSNYSITKDSEGFITVNHSDTSSATNEGIDILSNIEKIQFTDQIIETSSINNIDDNIYSREGTFLGNNYTIKMLGDNEEEIYAKGTGPAFVVGRDVFSEEQVKGIMDNYEYVIKSISKTLSWKGTLDFVVVVQGDTGHPTGLLPSIAFQHGEDLSGDAGVLLGTNEDRVHVATYEQLSGIDLNGDEPDLGFYINITENNEFKNYGDDVWIDPNPSSTSYSNLPSGQHDLISIITHEIAHAMGIAGTLDPYWGINHYSKSLTEKDGQYFYSSERITNLIGKDLLTEYQTGLPDDSLDHHVEDPEGGISGIASLMSGQMYSQRWNEPGPIEYAILYDSGWTERTTGKLSKTIDSSENILSAHTEDVLSGTLNFNKGDNIIILDGQAKTYRGLEGDDTYFVSQLLPKNSKISITDTEGSNLVQLPANTYVDKSLFTKNAARLTLEDGREITISGADKFSYNLGGNITNADKGIDIGFSEFAEIFGVYDILNSSGAQNGTISDLYII